VRASYALDPCTKHHGIRAAIGASDLKIEILDVIDRDCRYAKRQYDKGGRCADPSPLTLA
jgi:hypothetical protein